MRLLLLAALVFLAGAPCGAAEGSFEAGITAFERGDAEEAAEHFRHALEKAPEDPRVHFWLGRSYGEQAKRAGLLGRAGLAVKIRRAFERAVEIDPDFVEARFGLLRFHLSAPGFLGGDGEEARWQAAEIAARDPRAGFRAWSAIFESEENWREAEALYRRSITAAPEEPEPYLRLVWLFHRSARFTEAFGVLDRMAAAIPGDPAALYEIGRTAAFSGLRLEHGREALASFLDLGLDPRPAAAQRALAFYHLGTIFRHQRRDKLAIVEFRRALVLDPGLREAREALADLGAST